MIRNAPHLNAYQKVKWAKVQTTSKEKGQISNKYTNVPSFVWKIKSILHIA